MERFVTTPTVVLAVLCGFIAYYLSRNGAIDDVVSSSATDGRPIVATESGLVRGYEMASRSGRKYFAFSSIPYAKPPLGQLRFKAPEPVDPWEGILDADKELPICMQIPIYNPYLQNTTIGTEDCLYLSIFTPKISKDGRLPVMVFLHGGGWRTELPIISTASKASYIMDEDVILVIFHYRLGALGFLSSEDDLLPGNYGMKDQSRVLHWVSRNAAGFGGDPKKITVFGNSVGGASVHYHLISPMSKHLLQGGISESGVATCLWAMANPGVPSDRLRRLAKHLNCPLTPGEDLVDCLRQKSALELTEGERIFVRRDFDPAIVYQPVIETGPGAFLTDSPYNVVVDKPWIIGMTSGEGAVKSVFYVLRPELTESFWKNPGEILPEAIMYTNTTSHVDQVSSAITDRYRNLGPDLLINQRDLWTDGFFLSGATQAMKRSTGPVYLYLFDHRGETSSLDMLDAHGRQDFRHLGVSHTDELLYLFNFEDEIGKRQPALDRQVSEKLIKLWTDFAKYGEPTKREDWPPLGMEKSYLRIAKENSVETNLWQERAQFWENLPIRDRMEKLHI